MDVFLKTAASAALAYSTHYGITKLYSQFCVPDGWYGFFQGLVTTGSPICQTGVEIIRSTQVSYSSMIMMGISRVVVDMITGK